MTNFVIQTQGSACQEVIQLPLTNGIGQTITYSSSDTLTASAWFGGQYSNVTSPAVAFNDGNGSQSAGATLGRVFLYISAAQAAMFQPGEYKLRIVLTPASDGYPREVWVGTWVIKAAPGSQSTPVTFCTHDDVLTQFRTIDKFQHTDAPGGSIDERSNAATTLIAFITKRYRPRPKGARQRFSYDPVRGFDKPYLPASTSPPTEEQLLYYLNAGRLVDDYNVASTLCAKFAVSQILGEQKLGAKSYADELAARFDADARKMMDAYKPKFCLRTPITTTPDIEIYHDVTWLKDPTT